MKEDKQPVESAHEKALAYFKTIEAVNADADGNLRPEMVQQQVGNYLIMVTTGLKKLEGEGKVEDTLQVLIDKFPAQVDYMRDSLSPLPSMQPYLGVFDEKEDD